MSAHFFKFYGLLSLPWLFFIAFGLITPWYGRRTAAFGPNTVNSKPALNRLLYSKIKGGKGVKYRIGLQISFVASQFTSLGSLGFPPNFDSWLNNFWLKMTKTAHYWCGFRFLCYKRSQLCYKSIFTHDKVHLGSFFVQILPMFTFFFHQRIVN